MQLKLKCLFNVNSCFWWHDDIYSHTFHIPINFLNQPFCRVRVVVLNAIFNNISVITWLSFFLVEETRVPVENHRPATIHWQTLSHNVASSTPRLNRISTLNVSGDRHWSHIWVAINPTTIWSRPQQASFTERTV